jgi:hypothetical protein
MANTTLGVLAAQGFLLGASAPPADWVPSKLAPLRIVHAGHLSSGTAAWIVGEQELAVSRTKQIRTAKAFVVIDGIAPGLSATLPLPDYGRVPRHSTRMQVSQRGS